MSKLQIEVAARLKTSNRFAGDQKSGKAFVFVVLCTRQTMQIQFPGFKLYRLRFEGDAASLNEFLTALRGSRGISPRRVANPRLIQIVGKHDA